MNLFKDLPNNLDEEVFEDLLTHKNLRIERIVSTGQTSPKSGWYDQEESYCQMWCMESGGVPV